MSSIEPLVNLARALGKSRKRLAPSPPAAHVLGHAPELGADPLGALRRWMDGHGDIVRLRLGGSLAHVVFAPSLIGHVFQENYANYSKGNRGYRELRLFMGDSVFTTHGDEWRRKRRVVQPAFEREPMAVWAGRMEAVIAAYEARWTGLASQGAAVDVSAEMIGLTMRIMMEALFGGAIDDIEAATRAVTEFQHQWNRRVTAAMALPLACPTPANRRLQAARADIDGALLRAMDRARRGAGGPDCMVSRLLAAAETEGGMDDHALRDEVATLFLAGHESTSHALTWTWVLLAQHPEAAGRMRQEIQDALGERRASAEGVQRLAYTRAVFEESLRLYPPAWHIGRTPLVDDVIGGYFVPANTLVMVAPYATHRHPALWVDADAFDPDRFLGARRSQRPRYAYLPFGAGPRACVGGRFATLEALLVLAILGRRFTLELVPGQRIEPDPFVTLRPRHEVYMRVSDARATRDRAPTEAPAAWARDTPRGGAP